MTRQLATLALALVPVWAAAQPASPALGDLSLEQLGGLEVVTVSKQLSEVWRSAAAIHVLTADDIRRSGATSLPEALRYVPGLQVARLDSGHWAVGIRGLTSAFSKSLLVLIDGRSVYTPLFGGVFWQTQDTLIEDIERIEVIRGPGGTIWGANGMNGVINVITRSGRDTVGTLATVGGGSVDHGRAAFRIGGTRGDSSYRVYGMGVSRGALHHSAGRPFDDWRIAQGGAKVDTAWQGGTLTLQGDLYIGEAGDRVQVGSYAPPAQLTIEGSDDVAGGNVIARWQRESPSGGGMRVQASYDRTQRTAAHFGETRNAFDIDLLRHQPLGRRNHLSWGAGARYSPATFDARYPTLTLARPRRAHRLGSVFIQDEAMLVADRVWLTLGSKFEHNNNSGLEVQPSARLLWRPTAHQSAWVSTTRAVRTPSNIDTDLQLTGYAAAALPVYVRVEGNQRFEAERLIGVEAGYRRLLGSTFYVDLTGFHNDYDKLAGFGAFDLSVRTEPLTHIQLAVLYDNAIRGTTNGFEVSPDWRPSDWLQVKASYALLSVAMENKPGFADEANVPLYEGSAPRHQGFVRVALTLPRRVDVDLTQRFASRLMSGRVPAYHTADARVSWAVSERLSLAVAGANLLQPHHVEFFRDDVAAVGVPRSIYASATWRR